MIEKLHIKYLALYTITIVGVTILITLLLTNKPQPTTGIPIKQTEQLDSLTQLITVLEYRQKQKDSIIDTYKKEVIVLDKKIDSTNTKIYEVRKYYKHKIDAIRRYNPTELDEFFSNRYK